MDEMTPIRLELLRMTLGAAVPLWCQRHGLCSTEWLAARAKACGVVVASQGDIIQFKSKKKGETAKAFNAMAEGIACMALVRPEGVEAFGLRFRAFDDEGRRLHMARATAAA